MFFRSFAPTTMLLSRFVAPWEREGKSADDFFGGILRSRNPLERVRRERERVRAAIEQEEAEEALMEAETRPMRESIEEQALSAALAEQRAREFLPYGCKPIKYFSKDGYAAWGEYMMALGGPSPEGADASAYKDPTTLELLKRDMDTKLPYKYEQCLPLTAPNAVWPLHGTCGVVLDIDGVVYRSKEVIEGSDEAIKMLQKLKIPFAFMTNGGGMTEQAKADDLSKILRLDEPIQADQIIMAHTPMQLLADRHRNENILVIGAGDCASVARQYGFSNAITVLDYQVRHPELVPFKQWRLHDTDPRIAHMLDKAHGFRPRADARDDVDEHVPFGAVMFMNDAEDAFNDIQVALDVVLSPYGQIGRYISAQQTVPVYMAADDLVWATNARLPRLGGGAFREMFASLYLSVTGNELEVTQYGKPRAIQYAYAENQLAKITARLGWDPAALRTICMVGDNLETDIIGANARGGRWLSVHVLSGVGRAPAAMRTVSPGDEEMRWLLNFQSSQEQHCSMQQLEKQSQGPAHQAMPVNNHYAGGAVPHYVAPTLDHFLRELLAFGEAAMTSTQRSSKHYGPPNPVGLAEQYNFKWY